MIHKKTSESMIQDWSKEFYIGVKDLPFKTVYLLSGLYVLQKLTTKGKLCIPVVISVDTIHT